MDSLFLQGLDGVVIVSDGFNGFFVAVFSGFHRLLGEGGFGRNLYSLGRAYESGLVDDELHGDDSFDLHLTGYSGIAQMGAQILHDFALSTRI